MHNADYELVGDSRNILLGGGCMVHFPTGHKFAGQWVVAKVNSKSCIIVSKVDENGKPLPNLAAPFQYQARDVDLKAEGVQFLPNAVGGPALLPFPPNSYGKGRGNGPRLGLAWPVKFIAAISPNSMSERGWVSEVGSARGNQARSARCVAPSAPRSGAER